jgi:predicted CoA-binding protein
MEQELQRTGQRRASSSIPQQLTATIKMNQPEKSIPELLTDYHTIAVVGLSARPDRPSHQVAQYMQSQGYRIIPVNPLYAGTYILGEHCYSTLVEADAELRKHNAQIEIVDCFRKSDAIETIADEAIEIGARVLWMQIGVVNEKAANKASAAGLAVVTDRCIKIEHTKIAHDLRR